MSDLSPIDRLIDAACKFTPKPLEERLTPAERSLAESVAGSVLYHIDQMYPGMWNGVAKSARTSLRNTVKAEAGGALLKARVAEGGDGNILEIIRPPDATGGDPEEDRQPLTPANHSFDAINDFVHDPDVSFEELQGALLSMAIAMERR